MKKWEKIKKFHHVFKNRFIFSMYFNYKYTLVLVNKGHFYFLFRGGTTYIAVGEGSGGLLWQQKEGATKNIDKYP